VLVTPTAGFGQLIAALKRAAAALRDDDVPFLVAGGLASYARGGPPTEHDVDLAIRPEDIDRARRALQDAGMRIEDPPEDWLFKAYDGECLIDLIHHPVGTSVDDAMFERADVIEVEAVTMFVMAAEDILVTKLLALSEHHLDYERIMELARALREQIDWESARARVEHSPYALAFFTMADELGLSAA
jgi:predicted nucleotidyltransferase